jgi:phenylpyruvate tautomerase PptA (4-oxalocrotonate tautomerase family)
MPLVVLHMRKGRGPELKKGLLDAVHQALVECFKTQDSDRKQRVLEYAPEDFECGPAHGEGFTLVEIACFPGRSLEAKRALYKDIVHRFGTLGVQAKDVFIQLQEPNLDNWGVRGGQPASEVELGYSLKV